jgi:hypothetical protein
MREIRHASRWWGRTITNFPLFLSRFPELIPWHLGSLAVDLALFTLEANETTGNQPLPAGEVASELDRSKLHQTLSDLCYAGTLSTLIAGCPSFVDGSDICAPSVLQT